MNIGIVVIGFNRPDALSRLLKSLNYANYGNHKDITLIISLDYSGKNDCYKVSDLFNWKFGEKIIINHPYNLGLKEHVISCGNLSSEYDAIIMLEDDLFVSPDFFHYCLNVVNHYQYCADIGGFSLYSYTFIEGVSIPFLPVNNGFDNYFMKFPGSRGQIWTSEQWGLFRKFLVKSEISDTDFKILPKFAQNWPTKSSWKKLFFLYLISCNKYIVYPRVSLTTNFGDVGEHYKIATSSLHVPLLFGDKSWNFSSVNNVKLFYDSWFELEPIAFNSIFEQSIIDDLTIDLRGTKDMDEIKTKYLLSIKECSQALSKYSIELLPIELNVLLGFNESNSEYLISFGLAENFKFETNFSKKFFNSFKISMRSYPSDYESLIRREILELKEYKLGKFLLTPLIILKRLLSKISARYINR